MTDVPEKPARVANEKAILEATLEALEKVGEANTPPQSTQPALM
ncbi:MAG: hypothetical protein RL653_4001 [Pseudomonadota bacterium]